MRKRIVILYNRVFDYEGEKVTLGGIQTYLLSLAATLQTLPAEVTIYQAAVKDFQINYDGIPIVGVVTGDVKKTMQVAQRLLSHVLQLHKQDPIDLLIWGSDSMSLKTGGLKSLAIQHGIAFDYTPIEGALKKFLFKMGMENVIKYFQRRNALKSFEQATYKVCVDYNFLNWYRTFRSRENDHAIQVIPNFSVVNGKTVKDNDSSQLKVLFARRFVKQRGVHIMEQVVDHFTKSNYNISFSFAGEGPLEAHLRKKYADNNKVKIFSYESKESLQVHAAYDVCMIPTLGSEGTSFSLLEGMAAGCVPVVSNVGGMTNIIIDNFNGFMVAPAAQPFIEKIERLYQDRTLLQQISNNAYESVVNGFSYGKWQQSWKTLVERIV